MNGLSRTVLILAILLQFGVSPSGVTAERIVLISALEQDLKAFKAHAGTVDLGVVSNLGPSFSSLKLCGYDISALQEGPGGPENTLTVSQMAQRVEPDLVISLGPAGAINPQFRVGQFFSAASVVSIQRGQFRKGAFTHSTIKRIASDNTSLVKRFELQEITSGAVGSGELFLADANMRASLRRDMAIDIIDMNSFGTLHAAKKLGIPLLILRIISDEASDNASAQFAEFTKTYVGQLGEVVADMLCKHPPQPASMLDHKPIHDFVFPNK